jgi:glycosyltransferase involved in cell wall biosynthesis
MTGQPLVSVVMAVKNGEPYLAEVLESIRAQTYSRHETIVVDGGSTDGSVETARGFPDVRCIRQAGTGFCGAWNEGIAIARGEVFAILDSDDRWEPRKLETQVDLLRRRPELDYVVGRARFFLEPGLAPPPGLRPELLEGDHVAYMPGALLARRSVFETVGDFDTGFAIASDIEWFARVKDAGLAHAVVPEVVIHKRVHDRNLSHFQAQDLNRQIVRLLRESVARRTSV